MGDKERVKCDVCGKSFYSTKQLTQHTQNTHITANKNRMKPVERPIKLSKKWIAIIGIIVIIGGVGIYYAMTPHAVLPAVLAIDGIQCNSMEQSVFHTHAHLDIIIKKISSAISNRNSW